MSDHHSTHNPHGDQSTILENVKITMTYVPAIETENVETNNDQKEENQPEQHPYHDNNTGETDVINGAQTKEEKIANLALEQNKLQIINGIIGRSTTYLLQPCHCTQDLIRELQELSNGNNNDIK